MHNPHARGGTVPRDRLCQWADCQITSVLSVSAVVGVLALCPLFSLYLDQCCAVALAILLTLVSPVPVPVYGLLAHILPRLGGIQSAPRRVQDAPPWPHHVFAQGPNVLVC